MDSYEELNEKIEKEKSKLKKFRNDHITSISMLKEKHANKIAELIEEHANVIRQVTKDYDSQKKDMEEVIQSLKNEMAGLAPKKRRLTEEAPSGAATVTKTGASGSAAGTGNHSGTRAFTNPGTSGVTIPGNADSFVAIGNSATSGSGSATGGTQGCTYTLQEVHGSSINIKAMEDGVLNFDSIIMADSEKISFSESFRLLLISRRLCRF